MGFELNKKKGYIADINVTPFVDVVLVLLVIFMISAPLMFSGIKLKLPKTQKVNNIKLNDKQVILSLTTSGEFYLGKEKVLDTELLSTVNAKFKEFGTDVLFLRADYSLEYGKVARLMGKLKTSGISNIALVTEIEKKK